MPVFSASQLESARSRYRRLIHNEMTSVKKRVASTTSQPDPRFQSRVSYDLVQWDDFYCSMFHFLSGKTNRLLSERGEMDLIAQLGLSPDRAMVAQYVCDLVLSVTTDEDYVDTTTANNLSVDDQILWEGEWWTIKAVIPDSEGIQHTVFASK